MPRSPICAWRAADHQRLGRPCQRPGAASGGRVVGWVVRLGGRRQPPGAATSVCEIQDAGELCTVACTLTDAGSCVSTPSLVCGAKRLPHGPNRTAYWQLGARSGVLALRGQTSWHRWQQRSTSIIQRCLEPMASLTNLHIPFINSVGTRAHREDGKETGSDMMWYRWAGGGRPNECEPGRREASV